jgi:hypothetical protein
MYEHLNLRAWPFQFVPDTDFARIWAGRRQTRTQVQGVLQKMQIAPRSGLRFLWANFGMGKTHTLLHMRYLCQQTAGKLVPLFAVMPNRPASFLDLYRAIVSELPFETLGEQLVKVGNSHPGGVALHPMFAQAPGVVNALLAMRSGDLEKIILAKNWLSAQPGLGARDRRTIGVTTQIKTAEDAVKALTSLTKLVSFRSVNPAKLVIMVDEYQRIGELPPKVRNEINAGLHTYYNANATGLDITLSFSFGVADNLQYHLSPELKSRAEVQTISLDVLTPAEAIEFMQDLFSQFRVRPDERLSFPFTLDALQLLAQHIAKRKPITPRRLMKYGDYLLSEYLALPNIDDPIEVGPDFVDIRLTDSKIDVIDNGEDGAMGG